MGAHKYSMLSGNVTAGNFLDFTEFNHAINTRHKNPRGCCMSHHYLLGPDSPSLIQQSVCFVPNG